MENLEMNNKNKEESSSKVANDFEMLFEWPEMPNP